MVVRIQLNGRWSMRLVDAEDWLPAQVPGSILTDLLNNGAIEDPFFRDNEDSARDLAWNDYEYKREFDVSKELLACHDLTLVCEGLDTLAVIYVNDRALGTADNMHRTFRFDLKPLLDIGPNTMRIVFRSPLAYIDAKQRELSLWGPGDSIEGFPHIRKAHYMFGWDWGPKIPDAGIWRDIYIEARDVVRLDEVYVTQSHGAHFVDLDVRVRAICATAKDVVIAAKLTDPEGHAVCSAEALVAMSTGANEYHLSLKVTEPQIWWPNGYGAQPLYTLETKLESGGATTEVSEKRIGLRTMTIQKEPDQWGESFAIEVNGVAIFAQGADYIPEDNLLGRRSKDRTRRLLEDAVEANFNCIRVWGGGYYPDDFFYDLCDELGLVVWQDFMFACGVYRLSDEFARNVREEAIDNIKRLRHHASLGLWCGNNEMEVAWVEWSFPKTEELRQDYLRMFEDLLASVTAEQDPNTFYWPASPSSGGGFKDPNAEDRGDVHYWDVWHGLKPFTEYRKFYFRFCSEFGFQSFPSEKTVCSFTEPGDRNIFSYVMEKHQKNGEANGKILYYLSQNFKYPKDFSSLLYTSQVLQAEAIRYGVEHWRRNRGRCMGAVYWQFNDCWPVASWSGIDSFGRWKALHYAAKRFFAPVLLSACDEGTNVSFHVTNETMDEVAGKVTWRLRDNAGRTLHESSAPYLVAALTAIEVGVIECAPWVEEGDRARKVYLEYELSPAEGSAGSSQMGTVLFAKAKHFEFLDPAIECETVEFDDRYELHLTSQAFAKYVELDFAEGDGHFSDNYFDLSPGSARVIVVSKQRLTSDLNSREVLMDQLRIRTLYDIA